MGSSPIQRSPGGTPIRGTFAGARAHGLTSPILAQVDDGDLVGRWYYASYVSLAARGAAGTVALAVYPVPFITYNNLSGTPFQRGNVMGGSDDGTKGPLIVFQSSAAAGGVAGYQPSQTDLFDPAKLPVHTCYLKTGPSIAGIRLWVGLFSGGAIVQNNDDPAFALGADSNCALFRYSDGVDGGWVGICHNGVTGITTAATPTIKAIAANTEYQLRVRILSATQVGFQIDGETEVFINSANVPDWTNATNKWLNSTVSHVNKTAAIHQTGFMGDLLYLAG